MNFIDLTMPIQHNDPGVEFETKYTVSNDGWNAKILHLYSHSGTHMDSPYHFEAGPQTIDQIPLHHCFGRAWIVALDNLPAQTPITVDHLGGLADQIQPGDAVLFRTLWSKHFNDRQLYRDGLPPISNELGRWLVSQKVRLIGVEPPSVGDVNDLRAVTEIHHILLGGNVIIVEGLTNLDQVSGTCCVFGAFPLKVAQGDGAPCRAFAIDGVSELETVVGS